MIRRRVVVDAEVDRDVVVVLQRIEMVMRIAEEIDAIESMAIRPIPYLVTTRVIAGMIAVVPLYLAGLFSSYFATRLIVTSRIDLTRSLRRPSTT